MRKILILFVALFFALSSYAQTIVSCFLEKHGKDESIELTNIGRKMFEKMEKESCEYPKLMDIVSELENISIISSSDSMLLDEYYNSAVALLDKHKDFQSLFAKEEEESLMVMIRQDRELVRELVILFKSPSAFNLVSFTGNISLDDLMDYSRISDLDSLKELVSE